MFPHLKANLASFFEDHNQKIFFGASFGMQILSWLAHNWAMALGIFATSLVPLYFSWRKFREELRQTQRMNDLAYEEKLFELEQKKKQK